MKKYRVYFATEVRVFTKWFRRRQKVSETEYVVVMAHNEAHAVKEAKKHINLAELGMPLHVTQIKQAPPDEEEGYHGSQQRHGLPPQPTVEDEPKDAPASSPSDS